MRPVKADIVFLLKFPAKDTAGAGSRREVKVTLQTPFCDALRPTEVRSYPANSGEQWIKPYGTIYYFLAIYNHKYLFFETGNRRKQPEKSFDAGQSKRTPHLDLNTACVGHMHEPETAVANGTFISPPLLISSGAT